MEYGGANMVIHFREDAVFQGVKQKTWASLVNLSGDSIDLFAIVLMVMDLLSIASL